MAVQIGQIHFSRGCIVFHSENGPKLPSSFPITDEHLDASGFSLTGSADNTFDLWPPVLNILQKLLCPHQFCKFILQPQKFHAL